MFSTPTRRRSYRNSNRMWYSPDMIIMSKKCAWYLSDDQTITRCRKVTTSPHIRGFTRLSLEKLKYIKLKRMSKACGHLSHGKNAWLRRKLKHMDNS